VGAVSPPAEGADRLPDRDVADPQALGGQQTGLDRLPGARFGEPADVPLLARGDLPSLGQQLARQGGDLGGSQMPLVPQGRSNKVVIRHGGIISANSGNPTDRMGDNHALLSRGLQIATRAE
jgi:hypothetical protein